MSDPKRGEGAWLSNDDLPAIAGPSDVTPTTVVRVRHPEESASWMPILAENRELRALVEQLRADRCRLLDQQRQLMTLLGTLSPEKLVHDLRNLLNERELFKALLDVTEP